MTIRLRAGSSTDVGMVREINQDQLLVADPLFAVADGMGGHQGGEVASLTAVEALRAAFEAMPNPRTADSLTAAIVQANEAVYERAQGDPNLRGMGTTVTAVASIVSDGEERLAIANVGDSRAYILQRGELTQLTDDHSVPEELVRMGQLDASEVDHHPQRHMLTRSLGVFPEVDVDLWELLPAAGDRILLCSDGLVRELTDDQIASTLRRLEDPSEAASDLVQRARSAGGADNITVIVIDVVDDGGRAEKASAIVESRLPTRQDRNAELANIGTDKADIGAAWQASPSEVEMPERRRLSRKGLAFLISVFLVLLIAAAAIVWFARGQYFVGLDGDRVAIFRGQPGGLLVFEPSLEERSSLTTDDVLPSRLDDLRAGRSVADEASARRYIENLREEAEARDERPVTTTSTTAPTTTSTGPAGATTTIP